MSNSTTWAGMDVHKENIVTVSISGDSGTVMTRWETPSTAKGKERLAEFVWAIVPNPRSWSEAAPDGSLSCGQARAYQHDHRRHRRAPPHRKRKKEKRIEIPLDAGHTISTLRLSRGASAKSRAAVSFNRLLGGSFDDAPPVRMLPLPLPGSRGLQSASTS